MSEVRDVIEQISGDEDLPPEIAYLIERRLQQIFMALHHIDIGGPQAVRFATEALMGTVAASSAGNEKTRNAGVIKKVTAIAVSLYLAFTAVPLTQESLEASSLVVHEITAGRVISVTDERAADEAEAIMDAEVVEELEHDNGNAGHRGEP